MKTSLLVFTLIVSNALAGWQLTQYDHGAGFVTTPAGFKVRLPSGGGQLNSIQNGRGALSPGKTLTIHYRIRVVSGRPVFKYVDHASPDGLPPNVRPSIRTSFLSDRYWPAGSRCIVLRITADAYYTIKLKQSLWQDVNGRTNPSGFNPTLQRSGLWVLSYGGGGNFEHGVFTTGGIAAFDLLGWSVK
jgi:hypothetical protein